LHTGGVFLQTQKTNNANENKLYGAQFLGNTHKTTTANVYNSCWH